jgi:hypothetical protein
MKPSLALIAMAPPLVMLTLQYLTGNSWRFNDFYAYWLAGRLVAGGQNPYDLAAFAELARAVGIPSVVGGGYSYPPLFAVLMVPLAALPLETAGWIFTIGSALTFGSTVAVLLRATPALATATWRRCALVALAMGAYPPITTSLVIGQVNLLVLGLLVFALRGGASRPRLIAAGLALGLAASIKLVPGVLLVPIVLARRWQPAVGMLVAVALSLIYAALVAPQALRGSGSLAALFEPDPYWTNQSVNGFASRLLLDSDRTHAIWPDVVPTQPVTATLTALLAVATGWTLWRARRALVSQRALDLVLALVLVAATAGAPKTSFNNHAPALLAAWLLLARPATGLASGLQTVDRWLLGGWLAGALVWVTLEPVRDPFDGALGALRSVITSSALYGLLCLWIVLRRQLLRVARQFDRTLTASDTFVAGFDRYTPACSEYVNSTPGPLAGRGSRAGLRWGQRPRWRRADDN